MFSADDPYCGVDFDKCIADGETHSAVAGLVLALDSYTECSPSGTGLHVIVRATLAGGRRTGKTPWGGTFEVYDRGRYFTFTGEHVNGQPATVNDRQRELEDVLADVMSPKRDLVDALRTTETVSLDDRDLLDKAFAARNGVAFASLWQGDLGGRASASEADLALCNHLAFWAGGDPARIDSLFRQSGLMREKWERKDYRDWTIDKALDGRTEYYKPGVPTVAPPGVGTLGTPPETPVNTEDSGVPTPGTPGTPGTLRKCDVAGMLTSEPEPVDWLIEGVVARGTLTLLAGREKEGKSLLAMACAARGASGGGELAGIRVEPLRVLIIDAENGDRELHRRLRSLGLRATHAARIEVYEATGHDMRHHLHEVEAVLVASKPDLLILDSWRSLWAGDENDSGEVARVLDPLRNLIRQHNAGAVLIHHMRKGGGYRGSSAIGASVENVVELSRHDDDPDRRRRRLRNPACRYEQEADDRWLRIEADRDLGQLLVGETDPFHPTAGARDDAAEDLLGALNGQPMGWGVWARAAGLDPRHGTARRARDSLLERGRVKQDERGDWTAIA